MSALSSVTSLATDTKPQSATYYEWVRRHKSHLKNLIRNSNRANTIGAHERSCPICLEGQRIIHKLIVGGEVSSINLGSSFPKSRELPSKS